MCASPPFAATNTTPRITLPHTQQGTDPFRSLASHRWLYARATGASASEARALARAARNARYSLLLFRRTSSGFAVAPCPSPSQTPTGTLHVLSAETPPRKESVPRLSLAAVTATHRTPQTSRPTSTARPNSLEQPDSTQAFLSCEQPLHQSRSWPNQSRKDAPSLVPGTGTRYPYFIPDRICDQQNANWIGSEENCSSRHELNSISIKKSHRRGSERNCSNPRWMCTLETRRRWTGTSQNPPEPGCQQTTSPLHRTCGQ